MSVIPIKLSEAALWESHILLIHNIKDEQPIYILNNNLMKDFYQIRYGNLISSTGKKCEISNTIFPNPLVFDIETYQFEPLKINTILSASHCTACPITTPLPNIPKPLLCKTTELNFTLNPIVSESASIMIKSSKELLQIVNDSQAFIKQKQGFAAEILDSAKLYTNDPSACRDYHEFRLQPYRFNERNFDMISSLTLKWMKSIDYYVMDCYNKTNFSADDNRIIRLKLDFLTKDYAPTVISLILNRAISFCKVFSFFLYFL